MLTDLPDDVVELLLLWLPLASLLQIACTSSLFVARARPRLETALCLHKRFALPKRDLVCGKEISLTDQRLGVVGVRQLVDTCKSGGFLSSCEMLHLSGNDLQDAGLAALTELFAHSDMTGINLLPCCTFLGLHKNEIGNEGLVALSRSLQLGCLKHLKVLLLNMNRFGDVGMAALCTAARAGGALTHLETLSLSANKIGDRGAASLAVAAAKGHFPAVKWLVLERNHIGEAGMRHLSDAITRHDAFPMCTHGNGLCKMCRVNELMHILLMDNPACPEPVYQAIRRKRLPQRESSCSTPLLASLLLGHRAGLHAGS